MTVCCVLFTYPCNPGAALGWSAVLFSIGYYGNFLQFINHLKTFPLSICLNFDIKKKPKTVLIMGKYFASIFVEFYTFT